MAIETRVERNSDSVVRKAIMRELNREGQVFYLHNRVMTIERVRKRLCAIVPEARIAVGHGQMSPRQLRSVMKAFVGGEYDVLLCTTIIESGMDIPRANTILIDRADRFGIADLYQLRGRVGRSSQRAFAYLLLPPQGRPHHEARKRIDAIKRYTALGSGFSLALRDLEIRGAGNLLGAQQSGHIAAVGFGLYCQLLQRTIARMKGEPLPPVIEVDVSLDFLDLSPVNTDSPSAACLPYTYIDDEPLRLDVYRKFAVLSAIDDITTLREELTDRFGAPPPPVLNLLRVAEIRIAADLLKIKRVQCRDNKLMLTRANSYIMRDKRFPRLQAQATQDRFAEILELISDSEAWPS